MKDREERTDPGGPAPEVLAKARQVAAIAPSDATLVYDRKKGKSRAPVTTSPHLLVIAGPRKGAEFTLADGVTTLGRGEANTFVVPDISVSRQHVRLEKQGERFVIFDQGSGNGSRVNGKNVEKHPLQHGDEIELGDTRLQYVEPGAIVVKASADKDSHSSAARPQPAQPQPAGWKKRAPLYGAVLVALAIIFVAGAVRRAQKQRKDAEEQAQLDENRALAQQRFQEGVALLKQGQWLAARDKLRIAQELHPQDAEIGRYMESAEAEAPRAQALAQAKLLLARKDFAGAKAQLANVPDDSALATVAHDVQQDMRAQIEAAVHDARIRAEAGNGPGAQELLEPVLAVEPARPDALAVKDAIAGQKKQQAAATPREERRPAKPAEAPPPPDVQAVLDAYLSGDVGAAIEKARPGLLLESLRKFDANYKNGLALQQENKPAEAVTALEQAAQADKAIAGSKDGRLRREVRKALSALHTQLAESLESTDDGMPAAAANLRSAVQEDPRNEQATAQLRQIVERCKELYLKGYVAKDDDVATARASFKLVAETLPLTDETAQKAKRWLDKLDGKVAKEE
jgi:pSer/pThr/pTyr-binding forkhead associated (FHA) protein